ncbi:uncharacterized protein [Dermacentor albipictus]|uniref:uncharacterized protein isoform X2 n=1 Tax=Dermacentor albipictus TaxID=60249 RepID=UPI0031FD853E
MIPYSTCMRFASRDRRSRNATQWTVCRSQIGQPGSTVVLETDDHGVVHVKVVECSEEDATQAALKRPATLSQSEYNLLQALDIGIDRPLTTTPFLTLYRRRERQPVLQPWSHLMNNLDDSYHGVSERLLARVDQWAFNTFALDACSGGRSMPLLCVHLFHEYGFLSTFNLDAVRVWRCFNLIDAGYHSNNPYHNSVHAADVTQAMHCFLLEDKIREHMNPVEAMASLIAAVTHDLDHPGVNQPFLIATSNHLAALYNNFSVLENHHWRSAVSCLRQSGIFDHLPTSVWDEIEEQIRSLILATDITRQQEFLSRFKRYLENNVLDMADKEYRHFILQIALKCADLGNPCRPWDISHRWSLQVCKEFYRQGDFEKRLNIPVTPICDRERTTVAKIQADFFKFVVSPLFEIWDQFLDTPLSRELLRNLWLNHVQWEKKVAAADDSAASASFETDLNAPLASEEDEGDLLDFDDEDDEELPPLLRRRSATVARYSWMEETLGSSARGRRHSMPLSLPKLPSRTVIRRRRQSLPLAVAKGVAAAATGGLQPPEERPSSPVLSAENLHPTTSLLSLSSTQEGAPISTVLQRVSRESERRFLVHQPISYPPYRRTSEPFVATPSKRAFPRRSESVFAFSSSMEVELGDGKEDHSGDEVEEVEQTEEQTTGKTKEQTTEQTKEQTKEQTATEGMDGEETAETTATEEGQGDREAVAAEEHAQEADSPDREDSSSSKTCENGCGTPSPPPSAVTSPAGSDATRANPGAGGSPAAVRERGKGDASGDLTSGSSRAKPPAQTKRARLQRTPAQLANRPRASPSVVPTASPPKATFTIEPPPNEGTSFGQKSKGLETTTSLENEEAPMPSWSHRFSLTNEREAHQIEFDHPPEASWRNCARNNRRSSAPTALGLERQVSFLDDPARVAGTVSETGSALPACGLLGALPRRSSMPSEQQLVHELSRSELVRLAAVAAAASPAAAATLARRPVQRELIRRHSIGFLEPVAPSSESEGGSCATSTACSTRRGSCAPPPPHPRRRHSSISSRDEDETRDLFLPFVPAPAAASPGSLRRRRGSLPADVPLPLMVCAAEKPQQQGSRRVVSRTGGAGDVSDTTRRRGSTGEILSALIGPYGALHALQNLPRRGSGGGLELLSGLWRSRTLLGSDWSPSGAPPQPVSVAGRFKLQRQACSLESTSVQSTCSSAAGSVFSSQRRGSFPQEFSLFSFSSGELYCCDDGGGGD